MNYRPIVITTGEPAGIGMDIVIDMLVNYPEVLCSPVLILADECAFIERAKILKNIGKINRLPKFCACDESKVLTALDSRDDEFFNKLIGVDGSQNEHQVILVDMKTSETVIAGQLNASNTAMVERQLNMAHRLASLDKVFAIVTAPLQKSVMVDAGILIDGEPFSGHTEYFMAKCGLDKVVMMLANRVMKVALVTTHLPLKAVPAAITKDEIIRTVDIVHDSLVRQFGITYPRLLVCGLNPHAGESGHLGTEETMIINPALQDFIDKGMNISLALPADTLFTPKYLAGCDAVIAMYHDQGLAPLKSHGFGETVNITLGLPYVRTSVDHGTALNLAGTGQADSSSLIHAIKMAYQMGNHH